MTCSVSTTDSAATRQLAGKLAPLLWGGSVLELVSDLGGGKTTFTQGLVAALGFDGEVTSPTFTLSRVYPVTGGLELHHYDLYRLASGGVLGDELAEDMADPKVITVIEWADIMAAHLPTDRLTLLFEVTGDTTRTVHITSGGPKSAAALKRLQETV